MEKRQLVRTFGTALATATLSFGLFAAPALAQVDVIEDPTVTVISNGDVIKGDARDGYTIKAEIPVAVDQIDTAAPVWASATAVRYNGTQKVTQEVYSYYIDIDGETWSDTTKLTAYFKVDANMLDGVWTIDAIGISNDGEEEEVTPLDATFTVIGNRSELLPDVDKAPEYDSVELDDEKNPTKLTVKATDAVAKCIVTYTLPGGDTIVRVQDAETPEGQKEFEFKNLEKGIAGKYVLSSVEFVGLVDETKGDNHVVSVTTSNLSGGNYTVAMADAKAQTLFRLYNPWDGQHLYTGDPVERQTAIKNGWEDEGLAWYAPYKSTTAPGADTTDQEPETVGIRPVYRLYNKFTGEHHYTTGEAERITMIANGWTDEKVGFYSAEDVLQYRQKQWAGTKVFRLFNPNVTVGTHHYTLGTAEYNALGELGWNKEGIGWYSYKIWESDFDIVNPDYLKS